MQLIHLQVDIKEFLPAGLWLDQLNRQVPPLSLAGEDAALATLADDSFCLFSSFKGSM